MESRAEEGGSWRVRNLAAKEAGEKILSALLVDLFFVNQKFPEIQHENDYERVASYLR